MSQASFEFDAEASHLGATGLGHGGVGALLESVASPTVQRSYVART